MKKPVIGLFSAVLVLILLDTGVGAARTIPGGAYFGQNPPGFVAQVFAPGIISLPNRFESGLAFSPGLDECVFGVTNATWSTYNLWYTRRETDTTWTDPVLAPFQGNGDGLCPAFSPDGNTVYFVSSRPSYPPARIWSSAREGTGFGAPVALGEPIYSGADEWGGSFTAAGAFYFCSRRPGGIGDVDLYRSFPVDGGWSEPENLGAAVNSAQLEGDPCVAPDGSYVIFESKRPGGFGQSDLYISRNENGAWSAPTNLGAAINTTKIESGAFVSPDGKYLFFSRRAAPYTQEPSEIWWIDARAALDPSQAGTDDPGDTGERIFLRGEPNPFGSATSITYTTPVPGFVTIKVYDLVGREVQSLVNAPREPGSHVVDFAVPPGERTSGVYYCSLQVEGRRLETMRMVSLR